MIQPAKKLQVLLVEDAISTALPLIAFIESSGHLVTHVTTGEAALISYRAAPPDMVLMDLIMPGIGGIEATRQIKAIRTERWVPLIIMTALDSNEDVIAGLEAGADEYITKPVNMNVLSARMRAMQRISGIQKAMSDVIANVTDGIVLINPQGIILSFNRAAQVIFGYVPNEVLGENVSMLMPAPHRQQHDGYIKRFLTSRKPRIIGSSRNVEGMRKDGTLFPMQLGISTVMTPDGEVFIGLVHDNSEAAAHRDSEAALNKELATVREQALQNERSAAFSHLAAGIAHEMNTPLGYVQTNMKVLGIYAGDLLNLSEQLIAQIKGLGLAESASANRLLREMDLAYLKDDIPKLSQDVESGLEQIGHIVDSLRDVLRPGEPETQRVDLGQSVDSALTLMRGRCAPGLTIKRDYGNESVWLECSPSDIGQVLLNLLLNAIQAAGANGTIGVRLRSDTEKALITVADSGPGIAAENLPHIFNPFFTTRQVGDGKGLGLYVAAGLVRRQGGRIDVDSAPGKGSRFTVSLPHAKIAKVL